MLRGPELLSKVKELDSMPKSDVVRTCGYVTPRKDGSQRLNYTAFYEALLEAKGMRFGSAGEGGGRRDSVGRKLSYIAKVHFNGNLLVGRAYTSALGLKPGDEFDIKLERKGIRLTPKNRSGSMMSNASSSAIGEELEAPQPSAAVSPAPPPQQKTLLTSFPTPEPSVAPAPIPAAPVAPPTAPPAPGIPPAPQPMPAAAAPESTDSAAPKKSSPKTTPVDSWEDSLRKLEQSSRPRWDA